MAYLLDVSVVIALLDRSHVAHDAANRWFAARSPDGWGHLPDRRERRDSDHVPAVISERPGLPGLVAAALRRLCLLAVHEFWPDNLTFLTSSSFDLSRLPSARHVTDTYLLGLAASRAGKLATLDRRLGPAAVRNGEKHLEFIT